MKKNESEKPLTKGASGISGSMGIWPKMMHAMGGADALKDLVLSIDTSKSNLHLLLESLNFLILKSLSKKYDILCSRRFLGTCADLIFA